MSEQLTDTHHVAYKTPEWMHAVIAEACRKAVADGRWFECKPKDGSIGDTGFVVTIERPKPIGEMCVSFNDVVDVVNRFKDRYSGEFGDAGVAHALDSLLVALSYRIAGGSGQ